MTTTHGYLPTDNAGKLYCWPCWATLGMTKPALHGHTDKEQCDCCGSVIPPDKTPVYKATQPTNHPTKPMSDPTPTTQAVYAALAWIRDDHSAEQLALIHDYPTAKMGATFNALCILAAEVERLRARIAELENRNGKLNRSQVDMKNDLFRLRAETHAIRNQNADDSLTLATLYDMVLGDDWGDNSNKELIRAVGLLQRNATAEVERLRAEASVKDSLLVAVQADCERLQTIITHTSSFTE